MTALSRWVGAEIASGKNEYVLVAELTAALQEAMGAV
jgi:hypothetical protein